MEPSDKWQEKYKDTDKWHEHFLKSTGDMGTPHLYPLKSLNTWHQAPGTTVSVQYRLGIWRPIIIRVVVFRVILDLEVWLYGLQPKTSIMAHLESWFFQISRWVSLLLYALNWVTSGHVWPSSRNFKIFKTIWIKVSDYALNVCPRTLESYHGRALHTVRNFYLKKRLFIGNDGC